MLFGEVRNRPKRRWGFVLLEVSAAPERLGGVAGARKMAADPDRPFGQQARDALEDSLVAAVAGQIGLPVDASAVGPHGGMADPPPSRAGERSPAAVISLHHAD